MTNDYATSCARAAENQGLTEPRDLLTAAGIPTTIEQTGGFCMVLSIDPRPDRVVWLTVDGDVDHPFLVCRYDDTDDGWPDGDPSVEVWTNAVNLVDAVRGLIGGEVAS